MATDNRATVIKLLDALRALEDDYSEKRGAILAEMSTLLKGGEGLGPKITRLKARFQEFWKVRYPNGGAYQFANHAMVGASLKRWLVAGLSEEEISARMLTYVKNDESFYVRARHPFELFVKGFNQFVGLPAAAPDPEQADAMARAREMRGQ
jgi:hypothetical protein